MSRAAAIRTEVRAHGRAMLRDAVLDEARTMVLDDGWGRLRMRALASRVGVSRQTLHAEFGTKEALGQALVLREADAFLADVRRTLQEHPGDLRAAIHHAVTRTLELLAGNPLLRTVLAGSAGAGGETLLPLLTSRGEPLLVRARAVLADWLEAQRGPSPVPVAGLADSTVRLVVSHALTPLEPPDAVGARLADMVATGVAGPPRPCVS